MYARCSPSAAFIQDFNTNFLHLSNSGTALSEFVRVSQNHGGESADSRIQIHPPKSRRVLNREMRYSRMLEVRVRVFQCTEKYVYNCDRTGSQKVQGSARAAPSGSPCTQFSMHRKYVYSSDRTDSQKVQGSARAARRAENSRLTEFMSVRNPVSRKNSVSSEKLPAEFSIEIPDCRGR